MTDECEKEIEDLKARIKKLEEALEGIFSDFRQRCDDYHGKNWRDRW